jgi:ribosomal protein S18 acetylase RimI-like enzyme
VSTQRRGGVGDRSAAPVGRNVSRIAELVGAARDNALPILKESFTGYYRWHAKRTLREIAVARGAYVGDALAGVALLDRLDPEVGYVYYLFVGADHRRHGVGARLLDHTLAGFRRDGVSVVYAVAEEVNRASIGLFRSRGFRVVERRELGWKEGGLGAWGLRSRMRIIGGEVLLGLRLDVPVGPRTARRTGPTSPNRGRRRASG